MPTILYANSSRTPKRKTDEPRVADNATQAAKRAKTRPALGFTDDEKINGDPNRAFPLAINANILCDKVGGCLVDEGNPVDILYQSTFEKVRAKKGEPKILLRNGGSWTQRNERAPMGIHQFGRHLW